MDDEPLKEDLTIIKGVGPVYAARLEDAGINSLADLSKADPDQIATAMDVPATRVSEWIDEATFLSSFQGN